MSATFTLRLPRELLEKMRARKDINWAEVAREAFRRVLNEPIIDVTIEELVRDIVSSSGTEDILCLYLKVSLLNKAYVARNLELIYPGQSTDIIKRIDERLRSVGLGPSLSYELERKIQDAILMLGGYDKLEMETKKRLDEASWDVREAARLLSLYFIEDPLSAIRDWDMRGVVPDGFLRTMGFLLDVDEARAREIVNELVKTGLVFWDYYESRAYSHWYLRAADYACSIFVDLFLDVDRRCYRLADLLKDSDVITFLKWMAKEGLDFRAVVEYKEEDIIREDYGNVGDFNRVLTKLIKQWVVLIDYWPHRRRTGRRSSMPAHWVYKLTPIAKQKVLSLQALIEVIQQVSRRGG